MIEKEPWGADRPVSYRTAEGEAPEKHRHSPELDAMNADRGSAVCGILGALLGALVGAIPWFLASTFSGWFIGWLGFIIGWASVYGYRKLRGRKSTAYATATILVCSILALLIAEFMSWMYVLCTDPEWQEEASWYGESVFGYVFESLIMPENLAIIFENVWVGLVIGILGVVSARPKIVEYTDPERAKANPTGGMSAAKTAAANMEAGFALPRQFTVRGGKRVRTTLRVIGAGCVLFFGVMAVVLALNLPEDDWVELLVFVPAFALFVFAGVFLWMRARRYVAVDGDTLIYQPTFGAARTVDLSDLASMKVTANGRKLCTADGRTLLRFEENQENAALLLQYLQEKGVGLTA